LEALKEKLNTLDSKQITMNDINGILGEAGSLSKVAD